MAKEIQWAYGAVCYADGRQWFYQSSNYLMDHRSINTETVARDINGFTGTKDFQLNEIRTQDFLPALELDTEQKYNDVVDVFGLFGFEWEDPETTPKFYEFSKRQVIFVSSTGKLLYGAGNNGTRQLTYTQVMAIGKLKRMMLEREKPAPKIDTDLTADFEKGQKHDQSKPRFSLIPLEPLQDVIAVLEFGAAKYGADNWKYVENPQQRYLDAFMRHTMAWQSGELVDEESGLPHLAHAQCCLLFLQHFDK